LTGLRKTEPATAQGRSGGTMPKGSSGDTMPKSEKLSGPFTNNVADSADFW